MQALAAIVRELGGDLYAGGQRALIPGPGHSARDRSVTLMLRGGKVVIHSFAGDDWREVRDQLKALGLMPDDGDTGSSAPHAAMSMTAAARRRAAEALWAEGRPIAGTLSERHCAVRGVVASGSLALRHHPSAPASLYARRGPCRPALLAAITDGAGDLCGVEVTFLAADGARARIALPRRTIGTRPGGSAVRLCPAGAQLAVGEGVFTSLAAAQVFGRPAWALLSTGNLRTWRPPPEVSSVLIAADRGRDGSRSAGILAARLQASGVDCEVRWPPSPFPDWNDFICERGVPSGP